MSRCFVCQGDSSGGNRGELDRFIGFIPQNQGVGNLSLKEIYFSKTPYFDRKLIFILSTKL